MLLNIASRTDMRKCTSGYFLCDSEIILAPVLKALDILFLTSSDEDEVDNRSENLFPIVSLTFCSILFYKQIINSFLEEDRVSFFFFLQATRFKCGEDTCRRGAFNIL